MAGDDRKKQEEAERKDQAKVFGRLVRERRMAKGWTLESLAEAALKNRDRKSYLSDVEKGKRPNITTETVKNIARELEIDPELIPLPFRWPEAFETVRDTNTVVRETNEIVKKLLDANRDLAHEFGIKEGMLIALANRYAKGSARDFDGALAGLQKALEVAHEQMEKGRLPSNISEAVDTVFARLDELNDEGKIDDGLELLKNEAAVFTERSRQLREKEARNQAALSKIYDRAIDQARYANKPEEASRFVLAAFDQDAPQDQEESYGGLRSVFIEWYTRGLEKGLKFDLDVSVYLAREALKRAISPDQRGYALNDLGSALSVFGSRERGTSRLEEAVRAYRLALEEWTRKRVPLYWATAQMNLGNALWELGSRESGTTRLEEAVRAYRLALEEWTRKRVPLDWATARMNLGAALQALGSRESGTSRLEDAVRAYRLALEEWTRERVPLDWAKTQMNLGNALLVLGSRERETSRLEEAVRAYRLALEEWARERVPLYWATAQMNLGNVLRELGSHESGTTRLEEAVPAYRLALEEWTRERVPLDWATAQNNLGIALWELGLRERGTSRLEEAVRRYRLALEERTRERAPLQWAATQNNLGKALLELGNRGGGRVALEEARLCYENVLDANVEHHDFPDADELREKINQIDVELAKLSQVPEAETKN